MARRSVTLGRLERWARRLKAEVWALYLAYRDPRTPWHARLVAALVVAYAFSPLDLIPDPIPVLGLLDDLVLLPLGVALAVRLIPTGVLAESRLKARGLSGRPLNRVGLVLVVSAWAVLAVGGVFLAARWL